MINIVIVILGWIFFVYLIIKGVLKFVAEIIPQVETIKSKIILPIAKQVKYRRIIKAASKADIEGNINVAVSRLQYELPLGWIKKAQIEWIIDKTKEEFLDEEDIILRIRPLNNQDQNFLNALYFFFRQAIFPKTRNVIPETPREAVVLHICRRVINEQKNYLISQFEDNFLEDAISKRKGIVNYLERYKVLDDKGFFTGAFIREIHEVASNIRFNSLRNSIGSEISEILKHLENFIKKLHNTPIPDEEWYKKSRVANYALLLVARPDSRHVDGYVKRAEEKFNLGVDRLYILGTKQEKDFVENVISAISSLQCCQLVEKFDLYKDYRGLEGGLGALFVKKA